MYEKLMGRCIILTYDYAPQNGGIARMCFEIKKQFEAHKKDILVLTRNDIGKDSENDQNVIRYTRNRPFLEICILYYLIFKTSKDDLILCSTYHPTAFLAWLSGREFFILAHGAEVLKRPSNVKSWIRERYAQWILSKAKCVISNSSYTEQLVENLSPRSKSIALPLGVDQNYFKPTVCKPKDGLLNLFSISRLEKFKGHDFIIRTIASLPPEYKSKVRLKIGGKGPYKEDLIELTNQLGLAKNISFLGFVSDMQLIDLYSKSDMFLLCTRENLLGSQVEGFGLVFSEAQSCGTACLGTRIGGIPDAIQENNGGWLIDQDNKTQLTDLLMKFIDNPNILGDEGKKARVRIVNNCTWKHYFERLNSTISL